MSVWSIRRINNLLEGMNGSSYLEVGVCRGETLAAVNAVHRTGVDPKFLFDKTDSRYAGARLVEDISDSFFSNLDLSEKFDLIFLDGLHTFEQTYRDLSNALAHSHRRTMILIDDTRPVDVFSALSTHALAVKHRRSHGLEGKSWHGDVFKTIFAIHDFHPALNYRTISGGGNPQTLIWQSNMGWRSPRFNDFEAISRLTYFDLVGNLDVLRLASEDEAIGLCLEELRSVSDPLV